MTETKERYVRTERSAKDYQNLSDVEHVYQIPDTYIGSTEPEERNEFLLDFSAETMKLVPSKVSLSRGIERLFLEILSNAGDNADFSRRANIHPGSINVEMDKQWIKIRNGGSAIPVEPHESDPSKYIPDIIFGQLRTSSNYDTNVIRMGCGRNGFGAKLTNIFSKIFIVRVGDPKNKKLYTGIWKENMSEGPERTIERYNDKDGFVEISWKLDFERFGLQEYPDEAFLLFSRYVADFSLTCKIPVSFNQRQMNFANISDYARLYWSEDDCNNSIYHCEWAGHSKEKPNGILPEGLKLATLQKQISQALKADHIPNVEMMILDTPEEGVCISFVNGLMTIDGGVHTSELYSTISSHIIEIVNAAMNQKKSKSKKKDTEGPTPKLTSEDVRRHISVVINCRLPDPKYTSQSKTKLASPKPHIHIPVETMKCVEKWNLISRLYAALEAKMFNILKKTNGGRVKHLNLEDGEDANDAGTDKSSQCILYLVEGKSASAYPKKRIVMTEGGKDLGGWFPLRGKFMNVRNAHILRVAENKEIKAIKEMLGLREGVDYTKMENAITLRYGYILICTDADSDGSHITSLLINYFDQFYPGLLQTGRIGILRTPVVRIMNKSGKILHRFYTTAEYERWEKEHAPNGDMPKNLDKPIYFKGLGKSDDFEIEDDLTTAPVVTVFYDEKASDSLRLAFDKDMADQRKEWIAKWREVSKVHDIVFEDLDGIRKKQNITDYINHELIEYSKDALFRAIPSMDDGLKRSHRQALYAALQYFRYGRKTDMMGVSRFANYAANETNYHHGETSMCDTVTKMAQSYVGSNNLPFFQGKGQFGTRSSMGDDAASPRYLSISLPKYASLLYDEEAINCIPKRIIEGDEVEPLYLPAVIPMHLVNGAIGIATGYSSFIPNHNYYDIIKWCKERCQGVEVPNKGKMLKPWYKGFKGKIDFVNADREDIGENGDPVFKRTIDDEEENQSNEVDGIHLALKPKGMSIRTRGIFKIAQMKEKANIVIEELPVGVPIIGYRKWLEMQVKQKNISDFRDNSTTEVPKFDIKGYVCSERTTFTYKLIHLDRYYPLTNITMIDSFGYPAKFEDTTQVMEIYYRRMIELYGKVKQRRIADIRVKIQDLTYKIQFISAVLENKIVVFKRKKADILKDMAKHSPPIPEHYLTSIKLHELTQEEIEEAYKEITKLNNLYSETEKLTPAGLWLERLETLETFLKKNKF